MEKTPSPKEQYLKYRELFAAMSDEEILNCFNHQVGNRGWTSSRGSYLAALHAEFNQRHWDYSEIGDKKAISLRHKIHLTGKRISVFSGN